MKLMKLIEQGKTPQEELQEYQNEIEFWFDALGRNMEKKEFEKISIALEHMKIAVRKYNSLKKRIK